MDRQILRVYIGLPERLKPFVLWVAREYRTNPLSHQEGGSDVVVEYQSEEVYGYDWIKFPSKYVSAIFYKRVDIAKEDFEVYDYNEKLITIKNEIKAIYARKWSDIENHGKVPFEEVWNFEDYDELPWELLKEYDYSTHS